MDALTQDVDEDKLTPHVPDRRRGTCFPGRESRAGSRWTAALRLTIPTTVADYREEHVPGARYADLDRDLTTAPGKRGRHPLPDREVLARRFAAWGARHDG